MHRSATKLNALAMLLAAQSGPDVFRLRPPLPTPEAMTLLGYPQRVEQRKRRPNHRSESVARKRMAKASRRRNRHK